METVTGFAHEFTLETTYLNTATLGILPRRAAQAVREAMDAWAAGRPPFDRYEAAVTAVRSSFARLAGTSPDRVAIAPAVAASVGRIATAIPAGTEILTADGDFSSLVNPFAMRDDLSVRAVPLEKLADAVRPGTGLVAVSSVQSADGRIADLAAVRQAAADCGARVLVDGTQSVGWLPLGADGFDYVVCAGFKWLLGPHGVSYLVVREGSEDWVSTVPTGWYAAENRWDSTYGPVAELAATARRFDTSPAYLGYLSAAESLALVEEVGAEAIGAYDVALADRFRAGVRSLGYEPVPAAGSAIVAVPGLGGMAEELATAGIQAAARAGNLRLSFHGYNSVADVDHVLNVLGG